MYHFVCMCVCACSCTSICFIGNLTGHSQFTIDCVEIQICELYLNVTVNPKAISPQCRFLCPCGSLYTYPIWVLCYSPLLPLLSYPPLLYIHEHCDIGEKHTPDLKILITSLTFPVPFCVSHPSPIYHVSFLTDVTSLLQPFQEIR